MYACMYLRTTSVFKWICENFTGHSGHGCEVWITGPFPGGSDSVVNSAECLLRRVDHVQKSVFVFLAFVDLTERSCVADECVIIHEQVE